MREFRLFQPAALAQGMTLALDDAGHHHVSRVLRRRVGDGLSLFNGDGQEYVAEIVYSDRRTTTVEVREVRENVRESPLHLTLCLAWLKHEAMDRSVQKAVELGVNAIYPLLCARSEAERYDAEKKIAHWQGIITAAATQCGRARMPELHAPMPFADMLGRVQTSVRWIASPWHQAVASGDAEVKDMAVAIGPEGGFSDEEVGSAVEAGWQPLLLGRRILRADTAVIAALAQAQWRFGDGQGEA